MASKMIVALLVVCPLGAMAGSCAAGYKFKASLVNKNCTSSSATVTTCMNCCEKDVTLCGGNAVTCATGFFVDSAKKTSAIGTDAGVTNCCTAMATCANVTCAAPMGTAKTAAATTKCTGLVATCMAATCCLASDHCGAKTVTCGAGKFQDSAKAKVAWKKLTEVADCCSAKAKCSAKSTCKVGWNIKDATKDTDECPGLVASCTDAACCKPDKTKCGGNTTITCGAGMKMTAAKMAMVGTDNKTCCETTPSVPASATCTAFQSATTGAATTGAATTGANTTSPATTSGVHSLMLLIGSIATMNF